MMSLNWWSEKKKILQTGILSNFTYNIATEIEVHFKLSPFAGSPTTGRPRTWKVNERHFGNNIKVISYYFQFSF